LKPHAQGTRLEKNHWDDHEASRRRRPEIGDDAHPFHATGKPGNGRHLPTERDLLLLGGHDEQPLEPGVLGRQERACHQA
jgi:hypothetical protein